MTGAVNEAIGLLRTLVANLESRPLPGAELTEAFLREHGLSRLQQHAGGITSIRLAGHEAFNRLAECLVEADTAMERGANFADVQVEMFNVLAGYAGRDASTIGRAEAQALFDHFPAWFEKLAASRRVFVP